ncbi:MAG: phosphotransferase [Archaeoglobaceae archaeon]
MTAEIYVNKLRRGDVFRDWLVGVLEDRITNKDCKVRVFKKGHSSHTVCRFEFAGENYSVMAKFFAEPKGIIRDYDPREAMLREYLNLRKLEKIIDIARPIAIQEGFNFVLVTEYISGTPLSSYMADEKDLYDRLTSVANVLTKLHHNTTNCYNKEQNFAKFHSLLDYLGLEPSLREQFNCLLGKWWYSSLLDQNYGCMIHRDVSPTNYIFKDGKIYALDFESSWDHGNPVHDLGVLSAEIKNFFALKGSDKNAEPYIGHFLWQYSRDEKKFGKVTRKVPFYIAYGLLRISRLNWDPDHRKYLVKEAIKCLRAIEKV